MHTGKWKLMRKDYNAFTRNYIYRYRPDSGYNAAMLVEDLLEAGFAVSGIDYDEDADVGMKYYKGSLTAEEFPDKYYSELQGRGMGGMLYTIYCSYHGVGFAVNAVEDFDTTIVIFGTPDCIEELVNMLEKD